MKNKMKLLLSLATSLLMGSKVFAFFTDPSAGASAAYKEGDYVMVGPPPSTRTNNTEGKQVIINAGGNKAMIIAFASAIGTDPGHWFAPDKGWLNAVFNKDGVTTLDLDNSDLVFGASGGGQKVNPTFNLTNVIPFKKIGLTIKYDSSVTSNVVSTVTGITPGTTTGTTPGTTTGTTPGTTTGTTPTTANQATTGVAGWAWYIWVIIVAAVIGVGLLLKSLFGGKKNKVVKK